MVLDTIHNSIEELGKILDKEVESYEQNNNILTIKFKENTFKKL